MATIAPLAKAVSLAGSKIELVEKVKALATDNFWVNRFRGGGWKHVSNAKLLRLHNVLVAAKARFGSRAEIIEALATAEGHGKDGDYKKSREAWPLPRLMDALQSAERRVRRAEKKASKSAA